jgi:hypothetical protein
MLLLEAVRVVKLVLVKLEDRNTGNIVIDVIDFGAGGNAGLPALGARHHLAFPEHSLHGWRAYRPTVQEGVPDVEIWW